MSKIILKFYKKFEADKIFGTNKTKKKDTEDFSRKLSNNLKSGVIISHKKEKKKERREEKKKKKKSAKYFLKTSLSLYFGAIFVRLRDLYLG